VCGSQDDVVAKSAADISAAWQAPTICSSVRAADSMITLSTTGLGAASRTARTSASAASSSPERIRPTLMTMSTSSAPLETDSAGAAALIAEEWVCEGKLQTVATLTVVSTGSIDGERHTE